MTTPAPDLPVDYPAPKAFISYSWDDDDHKKWVKQLATRLRKQGVDLTFDHWHSAPGDQIPAFMERAVRENDFVVAICTPHFKQKFDTRSGGVGYEGNIMTAFAFTGGDEKKFMPVLRRGNWEEAAPSWLLGRAMIDLRGDPYDESQYQELLRTLHSAREPAPPIGRRPDFGEKDESEVNPAFAPINEPSASTMPEHQSSDTPVDGTLPLAAGMGRRFQNAFPFIAERHRLFLALIGVLLCALAAIWFYAKRPGQGTPLDRNQAPNRTPGELVLEHDPIAYCNAAELMAVALEKGNWSGPRGRLLRKTVTWVGFIHTFGPTSCVIQPAEKYPKYPQQRARVSFLREQTDRAYAKGEKITVTGIVGEFDEHGINIDAATIIKKPR
jgi:hypothetical protein